MSFNILCLITFAFMSLFFDAFDGLEGSMAVQMMYEIMFTLQNCVALRKPGIITPFYILFVTAFCFKLFIDMYGFSHDTMKNIKNCH